MSMEMDPNLCFVLMPMSEEKFLQLYDDVIKPTVEKAGLNCLYAGEIFGPRPVMEDVWQYCAQARVVIAELTSCNANVYYEVGYSHAFDTEKVIFIVQDMNEVTFDIRHFRCIVYDTLPRGIDKLKKQLTKSIEAVLAQEPQSPRILTKTTEKIVEVPVPVDARTREALELQGVLETLENGTVPSSSQEATRILETIEKLDRDSIRLQLTISAYWPELVQAMKTRSMHLYALLMDCKPTAIQGETLTVSVPSPFHEERLDDPVAKTIIEEELERLTNTKWHIQAVLR